VKKRILLLAAALCLLCSGCGGGLLEREWSSVTPHSAGYWENGDKDTLRADSYQDAVNAILMLVANHAERGVVRCYFGSDAEYAELAAEACNEVQQETDLGAYLLDYITYAGTDERGFYELTLSFGYRRTAEEQEGIINATSTEAIPDLLRAAAAEGADRLVVRVSYFSTDRAGVGADGPRRAGGEGRRKRCRYARRAVAGHILSRHRRAGHRRDHAQIKRKGEKAHVEYDLADSYCRRRKHLLSHLRKVYAGERERLCLACNHLRCGRSAVHRHVLSDRCARTCR